MGSSVNIISRLEAHAQGLKRYFTGEPCVNGHLTERCVMTCRCITCSNIAVKTWNKANPNSCRISRRKSRGQIDEPNRPKPDRCEMQGCDPGERGLVEDHDHDTGEFRGWICHNCNSGLGMLGDRKENILASVAYLNRSLKVSVTRIQNQMKTLEDAAKKLPQIKLETAHYWALGMYCRALFRPADTLIIGKVHKKEHFYIVMHGEVTIKSADGSSQRVKAPAIFVSKAGTKRAVYAHEDSLCITVHRTDNTDLEKIEAELIEDDPEALYDSSNQIKQSPKELT